MSSVEKLITLFRHQWVNKSIHSTITHKQLETHGCVPITVATDGLALNHQAIAIHSVDQISIALDRFQTEVLHSKDMLLGSNIINWNKVWNNDPVVLSN